MKFHMQCLNVPDQITDEKGRRIASFESDNALEVDPEEQIRYEQTLRPWTEEENRIFNAQCQQGQLKVLTSPALLSTAPWIFKALNECCIVIAMVIFSRNRCRTP